MRRAARPKLRLALALVATASAALLGATSAAAVDVAVRVNPVASYSAATMRGHGIDTGVESFLTPKWAIGVNVSYGMMRYGMVNSFTPAAAKAVAEIEDIESQSLGAQVARYHGSNERLFAYAAASYATSELHATTGGAPVYVYQSSVLPELGYGYRWLFRHGGFASLGGGMVYRVPLQDERRGDVAPLKLDMLGRVYPAMRIGLGYIFR